MSSSLWRAVGLLSCSMASNGCILPLAQGDPMTVDPEEIFEAPRLLTEAELAEIVKKRRNEHGWVLGSSSETKQWSLECLARSRTRKGCCPALQRSEFRTVQGMDALNATLGTVHMQAPMLEIDLCPTCSSALAKLPSYSSLCIPTCCAMLADTSSLTMGTTRVRWRTTSGTGTSNQLRGTQR